MKDFVKLEYDEKKKGLARAKGERLEKFVKELADCYGEDQKKEGFLFDRTFDIKFKGMNVLYEVGGHVMREEDVILEKNGKSVVLIQCKNYNKNVGSQKIEYDVNHLFGAIHTFQSLDDRLIALTELKGDVEKKAKRVLKKAGIKVMDKKKFEKRFADPKGYSDPVMLGDVSINYWEEEKGEEEEMRRKRVEHDMGELALVKKKRRFARDRDTLISLFEEKTVTKERAKEISESVKAARTFFDQKFVKHYLYVSFIGAGATGDLYVTRIGGVPITMDNLKEAFRNKRVSEVLGEIKALDKSFAGSAVGAGTCDLVEMLTKRLGKRDDDCYFGVAKSLMRKRFAF